ncbi:hypothetical protein FGE12_04570 [Aggregicoccus sp. 17bor-14]|uniref:hypothetical protein n=1 Tax=Myxococcaceae TaxID=31 RepID=UPI00129C4463|nr:MULTISPECIES: hypothetical protein [Myxococcaceae]MBF5041651.1 hypothetical protein [Simulacricoccus sp. 17bor-14]MRI87435.1 hypothetical protein [Aggregicoccus sp. 17bor-14]
MPNPLLAREPLRPRASLLPPWPELCVRGHVTLKAGRLTVELSASLGDGAPPGELELSLDRRIIPFEPASARYTLCEDASTLLVPGGTVRLAVRARSRCTFCELRVPGAFDITAPAEGTRLSSIEPLRLRWSPSESAERYAIELETAGSRYGAPAPDGACSQTFQFFSAQGPTVVRVTASTGLLRGADSIAVDVSVVKERSFVLEP